MPVISAAGDVYQVLVQGKIENQECENVLFFRSQGIDTDVLLHLLKEVAACFVTALVPVLGSTYTFERIVARRIVPDIGPDLEYYPLAAEEVQGQAAGDCQPSFVSALISLVSSRGGRSGKGRMFIAGVPESGTLNSYIPSEGAFYAGLVAFVACMLGKFLTSDVLPNGKWEWGVFSRKLGNAKAPFLAAGFAPLITANVKTLLATTRSRKIGHGR